MKNAKKRFLLLLVGILICGIAAGMLWMKSETERSKKLMDEFNSKIRSGELKPVNNEIKLHIGNILLVKRIHDVYAFKINALKTSLLYHDWNEVNFECYSLNNTNKRTPLFTLKTQGKVRQYYQKVKENEYRIDNARSGKLECGDVSFDPWSPGDEADTAWLLLTNRNGDAQDVQYALTTSKEVQSLDANQSALSWRKIKGEN
jgi:hypothetical protein